MTSEPVADLLRTDRALTLRSGRGRPIVRVGLGPGVAAGLASLLLAPRATAVAALAGMLGGWTLTIDRVATVAEYEAA